MKARIYLILIISIIMPSIGLANGSTGYYDLYYFDNQNSKITDEALSDESSDQIDDPFQPINQIIFSFNYTFDMLVLEPTAYVYKNITPQVAQDRVKNLFENLASPITFFNLILQGKFEQAGETLGRFVTNSTLGLGGLVDVASEFKVNQWQSDFGLTLAHYGLGTGPYIVLPIIGSTNVRDTLGRAVDFFADPVSRNLKNKTNIYLGLGKLVYIRANNYELINSIKYQSLDPYTFMKTVYNQGRENRIYND